MIKKITEDQAARVFIEWPNVLQAIVYRS